jgi:hypothetical protein
VGGAAALGIEKRETMAEQVSAKAARMTWRILLLLIPSLVVAAAVTPPALAVSAQGAAPCEAHVGASSARPVATLDFFCARRFDEVHVTTSEQGTLNGIDGTCTPGVSKTFICRTSGVGQHLSARIPCRGRECLWHEAPS